MKLFVLIQLLVVSLLLTGASATRDKKNKNKKKFNKKKKEASKRKKSKSWRHNPKVLILYVIAAGGERATECLLCYIASINGNQHQSRS